jgi:hypothetical protein
MTFRLRNRSTLIAIISCRYVLLLAALAAGLTAARAGVLDDKLKSVGAFMEVNPIKFDKRGLNANLRDLPIGEWIKIHEQKPSDRVTFKRQSHAGSAFDTKRGRIIIFGSDTHGKNWANSPLFFDVAKLEWSRLYPDDDPDTYRVNPEGIPVAGLRDNHPWAMHTFGSVEYDPVRDALVVSSYPRHMEPGRFTDALAAVWSKVRRHPTWELSLATTEWKPLPWEAEHFFPYATAYDSHRGVIIGYKSRGVFELNLSARAWRQIEPKGLLSYHNNAVYDSRHKALIVFGSNNGSNDIVVYEPATKRHVKMPTLGKRPPRDEHNPMAFHPVLGQTIVLVDRARQRESSRDLSTIRTETWLYDLVKDAWNLVRSATLQFGLGMNYNMEYDPGHNVLLLVTSAQKGLTAVWALRLIAEGR